MGTDKVWVWRTAAEKRRIVELTMLPGASVSRVAQAEGVNAHQVFDWWRSYREGRLYESSEHGLIPVVFAEADRSAEVSAPAAVAEIAPSCPMWLASASSAERTLPWCELSWRLSASDRTASGHTDMACGRGYGYAAGISGIEFAGADDTQPAAVLGPCLCLSRKAWRYDQDFVIRWRWSLPVRQAIGTRTFCLAAGCERHRFAHPCPVVDAAGRDRLA